MPRGIIPPTTVPSHQHHVFQTVPVVFGTRPIGPGVTMAEQDMIDLFIRHERPLRVVPGLTPTSGQAGTGLAFGL